MATDVSKIFKPHRGKKSTMAGTKKTMVLSDGEMFIEVPDTGSGSGHSKMKVGDGVTQYGDLPYAMGDTENDEIAFSSNTSTTVTAALNSVATGGKLKNLIAGLKQAISLCNNSITELNDDISSNVVSDIYVGTDGKLHKVIGGADTVLPFSSGLNYGAKDGTKLISLGGNGYGSDCLGYAGSPNFYGILPPGYRYINVSMIGNNASFTTDGKSISNGNLFFDNPNVPHSWSSSSTYYANTVAKYRLYVIGYI